MKKGRFLWSAHRITEKQKAGKARNIKEKQLKNSRSTASKPLVAHLSSASADFQRQQGFYRRWFPIGRTSPFLFAWLLFLKSRQFAYVKRKSTDKCAIGGGRNHRLSLQHGPATGLSIQCRLGNKHKSGPG